MLTEREFAELVAAKVKDYLPVKYQKAVCKVIEQMGNNEVYRIGITLRVPTENVERTVFLKLHYIKFMKGVDVDEVLGEIAVQVEGSRGLEIAMRECNIKDFQYMRTYLNISLVNTKFNRHLLAHMPHMELEDLSMVCRIEIPCLEGLAIKEVSDNLLKIWGVSKEVMFAEALKNLGESKNYTLHAAGDLLAGAAYDPENILDSLEDFVMDQKETIYILTNREHVRGASAMLCPWVMDKISDLFPEGFYIMPSSIQEVMITPKNDAIGVKELKLLVEEANQMVVSKEEVLSNHIYAYDRETQKIHLVSEMAEKRIGIER